MIKMYRYLVNNLFVIFVICLAVNDVSSIKKRSNIELESCIENFDVHKDKIIRTQDSRNMGAKYLNEIDLGSREECLRLCCETDTCDVFVYEEKVNINRKYFKFRIYAIPQNIFIKIKYATKLML